MKRYLSLILIFAISTLVATSQILEPIQWSFSSKKINDKQYELVFTASIEDSWHLYALEVPPGGPLPTVFTFEPSAPPGRGR